MQSNGYFGYFLFEKDICLIIYLFFIYYRKHTGVVNKVYTGLQKITKIIKA